MLVPFRARPAAAPFALSLLCVAVAHAQTHESPDEIVVTGVPRERSAGELAQSVTVVRGDALDRTRGANLGETLSNQLGVSSSYFGAGASRPIIRGLAGARVQMLEDGIDSMDAATISDDHAVTVEPLAADQIEIFRGPTTLLYGSGAVGGVINTVTTRMPSVVPEGGLEGSFELRGDSVANARGAAVRLDGGARRLAWHVDAGRRDSEDYAIPGFAHEDVDLATAGADEGFGTVENSAAESESVALGAAYLGERSSFGIGVSVFDTLYGIPGHAHEHDPGAPVADEPGVRIDLKQRRLSMRGGLEDLAGPVERINVRVASNDYAHVELEGDAVGTRFTNDATELRLELLHRRLGAWSGAFGAQLGERKFAAVGDEAFVPPVDSETRGLFLVEQLDVGAFAISLGGRVESQRHVPSNALPAFDGTAKSLSFGGVRSFGDGYSLVATLALSERLPVAEELYSDGPHLATGVVQLGDSSLEKETAHHLDVGVRGQRDGLTWDLTVYRTRYDEFIYLADTGAVDAVAELPIFAYAAADAEFAGAEAEVFVPLLAEGENEIDMRLFADYVRGQLASGEPLPRLPPLRYGARFEYHNDKLLVGVEATRYADQRDVAPFETETAGYLLLDADVRWRVGTAAGSELELFVNATNLGDEEARKHTSFVKDVAPLPGRNFSLGIRARF